MDKRLPLGVDISPAWYPEIVDCGLGGRFNEYLAVVAGNKNIITSRSKERVG